MDHTSILLVEDQAEAANTLEKTLAVLGYRVVSCLPQQFRNMLAANDYALVLAELHMPGLSGADITRLIMDKNPETCVVLLTGTAFISEAIDAMELGAYGYVTKPFNTKEITIVLQRAVAHYRFMRSEGREKILKNLSFKDGLTGVFNRRSLDIHLKKRMEALADEPFQHFSVAMIDVDNFKKYNDTKGHQAGDELLVSLARVFRESVRDKDVVFRYGGEEFCLYFEGSSKKEGGMIAERIRTLVSIYVPATVSMGVATFPTDGKSPEELIQKADQALYTAKHTGKNRVVLAP